MTSPSSSPSPGKGVNSRGVVAAGHPLTAEAGAEVLRAGGNAVDAAVAATIASFPLESALTGLGAGGFMMLKRPGEEAVLIDFFVAAPGMGGRERSQELLPAEVRFDENTTQVFNFGAASCGVPGTAAGLALAAERYGSMPISDLTAAGIRWAREGAPLNQQQAYVLSILEPIYTALPEARALFAPEGHILREGELFRDPDLADALERFGDEGPDSIYAGETAAAINEYVGVRGGILGTEDLAAYEAICRKPVEVRFGDYRILTNPPPSSGGILIGLCLAMLEGLDSTGTRDLVRAMGEANGRRGADFVAGLEREGFVEEFLSEEALERALGGDDRLGSTTHLSAMDSDGVCASVTCSNGTGSGLVVPGTGVHLNNMLGEEDLNPLGFHMSTPGSRVTSMMSPTIVLKGDEVVAGLGSAGSNRIRSAVLQTTVNLLAKGMGPQEAVDAARIHLEAGVLQAEPGADEGALAALEAEGRKVFRWPEKNLYFGGVQVVTRDPATASLGGGGDPRRGGAVAHA